MKINYLKLNNIGPYVGEHKFMLNTNSSKNVILIGGKNGAGKTSFLRAVKYGLFGSFAMGLKTNTDTYYNEIKSLINNKVKSNYFIEISFDCIENFETYNYVMRRSWYRSGESVNEKLTLMNNGIILDDFETKEISDKIKAMTSPQLINSFIFDGEKISNIIENDDISKYLQETFNSIFSIDLISQTQKDLEAYLVKKAEENSSKEQIDNINLITKISSLKNQIRAAENELSSYKSTLLNLTSIKIANTESFYKLGGLTKLQQENLTKRIDKFNKEKEEMNHKVRDYVETDLPLFLCKKILEDAVLQCRFERQAKYPAMLSEIENFMSISLPDVREKLTSLITDCQIIQKFELPEIKYIHSRLNDALMKTEEIRPYVNSKLSRLDEYKQMKKNLINNENIETINSIIDENKRLDISIHDMEIAIKKQIGFIDSLKEELSVSYSVFEKINEDMKKSSLYDASFVMGKSALSLCESFAESITRSKLRKISKTALQIFNDTIRKTDFITELDIDNKFDLRLKNSKGTIINPKTLSAGEMQILVSSLIWAMFRISGRREMFIFDTPLARLDKENRYNFITKIVSTIGAQVVILSTDSEFVGDNLAAIDNHIFKKYLLEYSVDDSATRVTEGYFGGNV